MCFVTCTARVGGLPKSLLNGDFNVKLNDAQWMEIRDFFSLPHTPMFETLVLQSNYNGN